MIKLNPRYKVLAFYFGAVFLITTLMLFFYRDFAKVGFLFHDYNFFRDYPNYLNPTNGGRWQPLMYYANWFAVNIFHFQPFWPKLIVLFFFWLNFVLGLWFLVLITKNKFFSFLTIILFVIYFRSPAIVFVYSEGCLDAVYPTFFLLGLIYYYYYLNKGKNFHYILTVLFYIIAILTMEASVVFPAVLFLMDLFLNTQFKLKTTLKRMIPFASILFIYVAITILTIKNTGSQSAFTIHRGEHYMSSFSDLIVRISHLLAAHYPSIRFYDIGLLPLSYDPKSLLINFLGPLVLMTIIFLFLKVPSYLKFFLLTIWILIFPFALFGVGYGFADRYVYFSGLFVIAFLVMTLKLILNKKYPITYIVFTVVIAFFAFQNIILLRMRIEQWGTAGRLVKNVGHELLSKYPVLPPSPVFIIGIRDGLYNAGHPGNFVYFLYNQTWPDYLSFHDTVSEAAYKYSWMKKCLSDADFMNNPPQAIVYNQERFEEIDLLKISQDLNISQDNISCDSEPTN